MISELVKVSDMFEVSEWEVNTEQDRLISGLFGTKTLHVDQESKSGSSKDSKKKKKIKRRKEESTEVEEEERGDEQLEKQLELPKKDSYLKPADLEENGASNLEGKKRKISSSSPENESKSTLDESIGVTSAKKRRERRKKLKAKIENNTTKDEKVDQKKEKEKQKINENDIDATKTTLEQQKSIEVTNTHKVTKLPSKKSELQDKLKSKLDSSRFRWINEQLYTITGDEALELFNNDDSMFDVYHRGFRRQVEHWPVNPVDVMIEWIKQRPKSLVVADFGCGDAGIAQSVPNKVHSFDLVAKNEWVTACNMAKVPLSSSSTDVAIFCLSLMGTDLESFIREAHRILKPGGVLKIAEVVSRIDVNTFIPSLCQLGFKMCLMDDSNKMFILMDLIKDSSTEKKKSKLDLSGLSLKPCIYKRR